MEGHFQMSRLTNFITKLFMKKVGIRKEVWLHCNSINLSPGISGLGIVYRGSTAIHLSYAGGCICQCCGGVQVVFGWQWWGNLELLAVKRVSEIKVFLLASTLNVNEIYKFLIIMTLRMLIWAPLLLGQNNVVGLCGFFALFIESWITCIEIRTVAHILLGINLCCNLTSCFKITTTWLAQLGEHRSAEREDTGSNPGQTNTQSL